MTAICIKCWDGDALIKMHLDGSGEFECSACDATFNCEEVRDTLAAMQGRWAKLIGWAEAYPADDAK